jgi:hypothetical protein
MPIHPVFVCEDSVMKGLSLALVALAFLAAEPALAQQPRPDAAEQAAPAPEMWYSRRQLRHEVDPWTLVHRRAAQQGAQRQARIAAMKWYGLSNSRPTVNPTPWGSSYRYSPVGGFSSRSFAWPVAARPLY